MKLLTPTGWKNLNEAHDDMSGNYDGARGGGATGPSMKGKIGSTMMIPGKNAKKPLSSSGNKPLTGDPTIHKNGIRVSNEYAGSYKRAGWIVKEETEIDYEAFLEHVVMNYPELVEEFLSKQDNKSE